MDVQPCLHMCHRLSRGKLSLPPRPRGDYDDAKSTVLLSIRCSNWTVACSHARQRLRLGLRGVIQVHFLIVYCLQLRRGLKKVHRYNSAVASMAKKKALSLKFASAAARPN